MLFGEYLVQKGYCSVEDEQKALEQQRAGDDRLIGTILMANGAISEEQLLDAVEAMDL